MSPPKITTTTRIELYGTTITLGQLREAVDSLDNRPPDDVVTIRYSPGDPRDQRERDTVTLEIGEAK